MRPQDKLIRKAKYGKEIIPKKAERPFTKGPVERFIFTDEKLFPKSEIYQAAHLARNLPEEVPDYLVEHHHEDCDETYLFIGFGERLNGLTAEVQLDGERIKIDSPAACFIPKGTRHRYKVVDGEGIVVITLTKKKYEWSR